MLQIDAVLGDRKPTFEDWRELRYTTRVINEAMRLYPQPPVLIRCVCLGGQGLGGRATSAKQVGCLYLQHSVLTRCVCLQAGRQRCSAAVSSASAPATPANQVPAWGRPLHGCWISQRSAPC